jgi:hypothetical protein
MRIRLGELRRIVREVIAEAKAKAINEVTVEVGTSDPEGNDLWVTASVELGPDGYVDGYEVTDVQADGWSGSIDVSSFEAGLTGDREEDFKEKLAVAAQEKLSDADDDGIGLDWDDYNEPAAF